MRPSRQRGATRGALPQFGNISTPANGAPLDGDGNGTAGGDFQTPAARPATGDALRLFRLFGDATVNGFDLGAFRAAFGSVTGDAGYKSYLDFDGGGAINGLDLGQFRARFGIVLP